MLPKNRFNNVPGQPGWDVVESFCAAAKSGNLPGVKELLSQHGKNIVNAKDMRGDTALHWAAWSGNAETVTLLLDGGALIDGKGVRGMSALASAAETGKKEIVALLLEKGASTDVRDDVGNLPLTLAKNRGHKPVVELIEKHVKTQQDIAERKKQEAAGKALAQERLDKLKQAPRGPKLKPPRP